MRTPVLVFALGAFVATGCGTDTEPPAAARAASEHGRWGLVAAARDGDATGVLDGSYIAFDTARAVLTTNLNNGSVIAVNYVLDEQTLVTPENPLFQTVEVRELTDSTLELAVVIQGSFFQMRFRPEVAPTEEPALVQPEGSIEAPPDDDPREG